MSNQTENPYQLAQYIIDESPQKGKFNTFDANPTLQNLEKCLLRYIAEILVVGEFFENLKDDSHPNQLIKRLAIKADEFCPSRTTADLLMKSEIVNHVFEHFMTTLMKVTLNRTTDSLFGGLSGLSGLSGFGSSSIIEVILKRKKTDK
ncbi:hypothetical protein [Spirosoma panaciterrae]|uniref:hypothetical protein n=1 Tax=Spirosoma panaciterrae TaxID=496058 RepID=UPI0003747320|nr:hypothetical protein [Spirosoma panaciterrae]